MRFPVWVCLPLIAACASTPAPVPEAWRSVPRAAQIADLCAKVQCAPRATAAVRIVDNKLVAGEKVLTPQFAAIQSFDVSIDRREVVFSAKRTDNFDIGLVSLDGSDIHWIPEDPADETDVQWAPRGNKVSYIVHTKTGDVVRTVHIPTAMQLSVPFPDARVLRLAWDPPAERYAVVVTSPDASERIESMEYSGAKHRTDVPPEVHLDVVSEPLGGALVLRPPAMHYGERLPFVVWISERPLVWDDARGALLRGARVACAVLGEPPAAAFWAAVRGVPWIDSSRVYVVFGGAPSAAVSIAGAPRNATLIEPADGPGYRIAGNRVFVPRAVVESFAAFWIPRQLKDRNGVQ